jgi:hypothetical protein
MNPVKPTKRKLGRVRAYVPPPEEILEVSGSHADLMAATKPTLH